MKKWKFREMMFPPIYYQDFWNHEPENYLTDASQILIVKRAFKVLTSYVDALHEVKVLREKPTS